MSCRRNHLGHSLPRTHCIKVSSSCLSPFTHVEALLVTSPISVIGMCLCVWLWESKVTTTPGVRQGAEGNIHHHESCHAGISIRRRAAVAASRWDRETLAENVLCHYSKFYFAATGASVDRLCFFLTVSQCFCSSHTVIFQIKAIFARQFIRSKKYVYHRKFRESHDFFFINIDNVNRDFD